MRITALISSRLTLLLTAMALAGSSAALDTTRADAAPWPQDPPPTRDDAGEAEDEDQQQDEGAEDSQEGDEEPARDARPLTGRDAIIDELINEIAELRAQLSGLRQELAQARLESDLARRELEELQQFIRDNREYGDDFEQYQAIKEITEREERFRRQQEARQRREEEAARRRAQRDLTAAQQEVAAAEEAQMERYRRAGFEPLGMDVYLGRAGFFYHMKQQTSSRVEYEPFLGAFLEPVQTAYVDYSEMTISGSILNASGETRSLGVAIAFFDRRGNQVGAATVQINNARPNVPYPFTSQVKMALGEPFATSSSWVLYADPVE